jgi:ElaB/YqjD/DUF883 family membrane-anchored ribosome-binding protein
MQKNGTTTQFEARLDALKDSVRHLVDVSSIKDKMSSAKDAVVSGSTTAVKKTGSLIKEHPIIAIGVAFGIGFIAFKLLRR